MINFIYEDYIEDIGIIEILQKDILNTFILDNESVLFIRRTKSLPFIRVSWIEDYFRYNELLKGINTIYMHDCNIHETVMYSLNKDNTAPKAWVQKQERKREREIQSLVIPRGRYALRNKSLGPMMQLRSRRNEAVRVPVDARCHIHVYIFEIFLCRFEIFPYPRISLSTTRSSNVGISMRLRPAFVGSVIVPALGPYRHSEEGPHALNEYTILRSSLLSFLFLLRLSFSLLCSEHAERTLSLFGWTVVPFERRKNRARGIKDVPIIDGSGMNKARRMVRR